METLLVSPLDGERGLRLLGELDMQSAHVFREALANLPGAGQTTLDLSELTFIDSSGLHAILDFANGVNGNGALVLAGMSPMWFGCSRSRTSQTIRSSTSGGGSGVG